MNAAELIEKILRDVKTIAVVGLSDDPSRASYGVSRYMQKAGYKIIPVNPGCETVLGEKCFPTLAEIQLADGAKIDLVNVFRLPKFVPAIVDEVIQLKIPYVWLQEGIVDQASAAKAREHGIGVVMDRCLYKEHHRIGRRAK